MIGFAVPIGAAHLQRESFYVNRMRCGDNFRKFNNGQFKGSTPLGPTSKKFDEFVTSGKASSGMISTLCS